MRPSNNSRTKKIEIEGEMTLQEVGDDYTKDGTVDLRGNPVRRSQRGRWKACSFVIGMYYNFPYF